MTQAERKCIENKILLHSSIGYDEKFKAEEATAEETLERLLHMSIADELEKLLEELDTLEGL